MSGRHSRMSLYSQIMKSPAHVIRASHVGYVSNIFAFFRVNPREYLNIEVGTSAVKLFLNTRFTRPVRKTGGIFH